jgi:hypothetical protein
MNRDIKAQTTHKSLKTTGRTPIQILASTLTAAETIGLVSQHTCSQATDSAIPTATPVKPINNFSRGKNSMMSP